MAIEQDSRAKELDRARSTIEQQTTEIQQLRTSVDTLEERARDDAGELNRRLAESDALRQVAAAISSVMEVQPLLEMIMEKSKEVMDAEASSLMLLDEETQELVFNVATGEKGAALREIRLPLGGVSPVGWPRTRNLC